MRRMTCGILVASGLALAVGSASAQSNPSADSIINSLTPRAGVGGSSRGIRPLNPTEGAPAASPATSAVSRPGSRPPRATPAASPGTAAPRAPAAAAAEAPSVNLTVQFANNSAELTPAAIRTLDELGRALSSQALSSYKFRIEGHTDTLGNAEHNMTLSEQRANAVVDYLVNKFHVDRTRLEATGLGETHLLVPTRDQVAEPRNRRVTVVNVGA